MITDTCKCGAEFKVDYNASTLEGTRHNVWLDAHKGCREAGDPCEECAKMQAEIDEVNRIMTGIIESTGYGRLQAVVAEMDK